MYYLAPRLFFIAFLLQLFLCTPIQGQQSDSSKIDSLERLLNAADNEFQKVEKYLLLARANIGVDSASAFGYSTKALAFFTKNKDSFGLAKALEMTAKCDFFYGRAEQAEDGFRKAIKIFEGLMANDSTSELIQYWIDAKFNLGSSLGNQGQIDQGLETFLSIGPMAKKIGDFKTMALMNTSIGLNYYNSGQNEKAYEYLSVSPEFYEKANVPEYFLQDRLVFAATLRNLDSLPKMKTILNQANTVLQTMPNSWQWFLYYRMLGEYQTDNQEFTQALTSYHRAREILEEKKVKGFLPGLLVNYAETYELMGDNKMAKNILYELYDLDEEITLGKLNGLKQLARLEELDNRPEKALKYLNEFNEVNDSLNSKKIAEDVAKLEQKYQNEKKEREIAELQLLNDRTDLDLEKKKSQNYLLFILLGSLLFLLVSGYLTYRNRQKKAMLREKAQEQEIYNLKADQERKLFGVMMDGVEQERKRLAADLHDGLGGRLSGISIKLSRLSEDKAMKKVVPEIDTILGNIDDSLQELRGVARNLMPETLLKYGLKAALEDYCSTLKGKDTNIVLQYYSNTKITDKNKELTLYRIIQELINNAVKHAKATEILVQFIHDEEKIAITVEDDGVGFEDGSPKKKNGMGLANLKNRVHFLEGKMDVRSVINEGTSVNIQIERI